MAKKRYLAWSPVRELMKSVGAAVVARDAVDYLIKILEAEALELTTTALTLTRHAKRTKLSKADLELVLKMK